MAEKKKLILTIDGHMYDVTNFDHPGDGIKDIYINDYNDKDVSKDFDDNHFTDDPFEMLQEARENGEYDGIKYLGPSSNK